jgi:hypothetical protein
VLRLAPPAGCPALVAGCWHSLMDVWYFTAQFQT